MAELKSKPAGLRWHLLTKNRWPDFEELFGPHGAYGGCWCMWWRSTRREFGARKGDGNRLAMKAIVASGDVPGVLAYVHGKVAGWCAVAPRERFGALERSRVLKRLDGKPVWSITCFYVGRGFRGQGMATALIAGALEHVGAEGGRIVEAYPTVPRGRQLAPVSSYMGVPAMFAGLGFEECARPSQAKMIMRCRLG
jgi:GNAT superfamily N-acetyltransferase